MKVFFGRKCDVTDEFSCSEGQREQRVSYNDANVPIVLRSKWRLWAVISELIRYHLCGLSMGLD